jgi:hypothetical protein
MAKKYGPELGIVYSGKPRDWEKSVVGTAMTMTASQSSAELSVMGAQGGGAGNKDD